MPNPYLFAILSIYPLSMSVKRKVLNSFPSNMSVAAIAKDGEQLLAWNFITATEIFLGWSVTTFEIVERSRGIVNVSRMFFIVLKTHSRPRLSKKSATENM